MESRADYESATKLAADIVIAYVSRCDVAREDLPQLVREIRQALLEDSPSVGPRTPAAANETARAGASQPAVPPEQSVFPDYIISLEDGARYRSLRRHLMARYGMTPEAYREKWNLPADYPMVAPNYAKQRSEVARRIGLGRNKAPAPRKGSASRSPRSR